MEPILHIILPLIALLLLGEKPKTAITLAVIGILPDVDALLLIHRSLSHSIIIMTIVFAPIILYTKFRRPELQKIAFLAFLVAVSHPILDLESLTPIFWPIYQNSISIKLAINGVVDQGYGIRPIFKLSQSPTDFTKALSIDYPIFTTNGLLISMVLILPVMYNKLIATNGSVINKVRNRLIKN